jgi:FkbM family methyltransferase
MVFVDCGAYVGDSTEDFLLYEKGVAKIYAFEPIKKLFTALNKRCDRLAEEWAIDRNNFICVNAGVGEKDGSASIFIPTGNSASSTLYRNFTY